MRVHTYLLVCLLFLPFSLLGQYHWATQSGGDGAEATDVAIDAFGNSYVVAKFTGTTTFDGITLVEDGTVNDQGPLVLVKYSPSGAVIWATPIRGKTASEIHGVTIDANGQVYVCGGYDHTNDFTKLDFGHGIILEGNASTSVFLAMADSMGTFQWATRILATDAPGSQYIIPYDVVADANDGVYIIGEVLEPVDIDGQSFNTNNPDRNQLFVAKYETDGDFLWFRHTDNAGQFGRAGGRTLALAPNGGVYFAGTFTREISYEGETIPPLTYSNEALVVGALSAAGALNWWRWVENAGSGGQAAHEFGVDGAGNLYVDIRGQGNTSLMDTAFFASVNRYLVKYDPNGNRQFVKPMFTSGFQGIQVHTLLTRPDGTTYAIGGHGTSEVIFGADTLPVVNPYGEHYFVAGYTSDGTLLGVHPLMDSTHNDLNSGVFTTMEATSVQLTPQGSLLLTGFFEGKAYAGADSLDSEGLVEDMFLMDFSPSGLWLTPTTALASLPSTTWHVYPNPATDVLYIRSERPFDEGVTATLLNLQGQTVLQQWVQVEDSLSLAHLPAGMYVLRLSAGRAQVSYKIKKGR